jgi:hypothetical protein
MRPGGKISAVMLAVALLLGGCGEDTSSNSSVAAALLIPRDLVDDLGSITIYVIETDKETHQPDCVLLEGDHEAYKSVKVVKDVTVDFDPIQGTSALIENIPDRGRVWRFYARGFDTGQQFIAHGCEDGVRDVPANDTITLSITLERAN